MNRIWKFILSLVILETTLLICCYLWFSKNSIESSNIRKRGEKLIPDDIQNKSDITFESNLHGKGKTNASAFLAYFKRGLSVVTGNPNKIQRHDSKLRTKVSRKRCVKSMMSPIVTYKCRSKRKRDNNNIKDAKFHLRNRWNVINGSGSPSVNKLSIAQKVNKTQCTFFFDQKSIMEAKKNLTKSYFLFYINLTINDINYLHLNETEQDQLIHWQYVRKSEKFLVQLPVDFDLLTYNLLVFDKEETVLNIKVDYNHSTCTPKFNDQVESIRLLLWNELFDHNTTYYLCNRNFTNSTERNALYYITTIWVGYDLSCSKVSTDGSIETTSLKKDHLPLVTPFFCYFLSLQFVWIFALLDLKNNSDCKSSDTQSDINEIKTALCPKSTQIDQKPSYREKDRPYGIKRFLYKIIYSTCACTCTKCNCECGFFNQPVIRLLFILYLTILFPFGLYRTLGRQRILGYMYNNYVTVVRPSEPIFEPICKSKEWCKLNFDIVYATVFPFIYIILGYISYKLFLTIHIKTCCCFPEIDGDEKVIRKSKGVSDRFAFWYYQLCMILSKEGCKPDRLKCVCCAASCCNDCSICRYFVWLCMFISNFIFCLFPIIPFSFCKHINFCPVDRCCDGKNVNNRKSKGNQFKNQAYNSIEDEENNGMENISSPEVGSSEIESGRADTEKRDNTKNGYCTGTCIVWWLLQVICIFPLTYMIYLRPIISTFTFLLRSFTYFVFVALPMRAHMLRYTMLIVTTITYFGKYFHEIVNMNADILNHLFTCGCEGETQNSNGSTQFIDEELFDYVYKRLMFVRKKLYFMFLKMIVVFMYLFITIETFITNKSSLTGSSFKDILEFLLIIIGPYAISLFLKVNKEDFLTEENKTEIKNEYTYFMSDKKVDNETKVKTQIGSTSQNQLPVPDSTSTSSSADTNADDQIQTT